MSTAEKEQKLARQEKITSRILLIPLLMLLVIVPLIVRVTLVEVGSDVSEVLLTNVFFDLFSQGKSVGIISMTILIGVMTFLLFNKAHLKVDKNIKIYGVSATLFLVASLISALLSSYRQVAMWGMPDRAEGLIIIACYIVIFLYSIYIIKETSEYRYILGGLSILILITTVLGIFQYIGKDLLMTKAFSKLIFPEQYLQYADSMTADYQSGKVYGTMFHYNYMGSFGAMMVPLFMTLTLCVKDWKGKLVFGSVTLMALFLLFGSTSRAGIIGIILSLLIAIIVFAPVLLKKWKFIIPGIAMIIVILIGFNISTKGAIFSRIPTLVNDAVALFLPGDQNFDYKDYIPVREVISQDGYTTIILQDESLDIITDGESIQFIDKEGQPVKYDMVDGKCITEDSRFSHIIFKIVSDESENGKKDLVVVNINQIDAFLLKVDSDNGVRIVNKYTYEPISVEEPEAWGFVGKEKLGSARGYIWSRSLPLLKNNLLFGSGPDTFALEFPQNDYMGKWWAYDTPNIIVDKPHNLYLQIGINQGIIALIAFLVIVITYIVESIRLYGFKSYYTSAEAMGIGSMLAVVGYLGAGIFNDSIISVAPIFWIILGTGIALNYIYRKEQLENQKRLERKIIQI